MRTLDKATLDARWPAACRALARCGFPAELTHLGPRCLADDTLWRDTARCILLRSPLAQRSVGSFFFWTVFFLFSFFFGFGAHFD
jgi:hypothetical protein